MYWQFLPQSNGGGICAQVWQRCHVRLERRFIARAYRAAFNDRGDAAKNIDIQDQFPKSVHELELNAFDVIVNLSGMPLPASPRAETLVWKVTDPMTQGEDVYLQVRDQIEGLVMQLILQIRRQTKRMALQTPAVAPRLPLPAAVPAAAGPTPVARPPIAPTPVAPTGATGTPQSSSQFRFGRMRRARD